MVGKVTEQKVKKSVARYSAAITDRDKSSFDSFFDVKDNLRAEYDMWAWIYQEIATIRIEVSRLGTLVRLNNPSSPGYLEAYHAQLYALLVPVSPVIKINVWKKIEQKWLECKKDIDAYFIKRKAVPNKKIDFELIKELDKLYRIALIIIQKCGLGFKTTSHENIEEALEAAIAGD